MTEQVNQISLIEAIEDSNKIVVTKSLPYTAVRLIMDNVKTSCLSKNENGILTLDAFAKTVALQFNYIIQKTNIDYSDSGLPMFHILKENDIIYNVLLNMRHKQEYDEILAMINEEIQEELRINKIELESMERETNSLNHDLKIAEIFDYLKENSVEAQLKHFLNVEVKKYLEMAISKIPDKKGITAIIKNLKKEIAGFDKDKLGFIGKSLESFGEKGLPDTDKMIETAEKILENMNVKKSK